VFDGTHGFLADFGLLDCRWAGLCMGPTEPSVSDVRFVAALWLPISAVAFALISVFLLIRRWLRGWRITVSWIDISRAMGCFAGLWAMGLAIWFFTHGDAFSLVWIFGVLGLLMALPWQVITRTSVWWVLFSVLAVFTLLPLLALSWLLTAFIFSTPRSAGSIPWLVGGLLSVAFQALQILAVWRLRRRRLSYHSAA